MKIERFEDIEAWKEARKLVNDIYGCFRNSKDIGFKSQAQRASLSIMSNIAEGFGWGEQQRIYTVFDNCKRFCF